MHWIVLYLPLLLGCVAKPFIIGWRLPPSNSTQLTDWVWQLLCFRRMQVITADTVVAYITHDAVYRQHQAGTEQSDVMARVV